MYFLSKWEGNCIYIILLLLVCWYCLFNVYLKLLVIMGKGKIKIGFLINKRIWMEIFKNWKDGIMKKVKEFLVFCGVLVCVIIFGLNDDFIFYVWF